MNGALPSQTAKKRDRWIQHFYNYHTQIGGNSANVIVILVLKKVSQNIFGRKDIRPTVKYIHLATETKNIALSVLSRKNGKK